MYFDGSGDYLTIPYSANLNLVSGNYTIELWYYPNSLPQYALLVMQDDGISASQNFQLRATSAGLIDYIFYSTSARASAVTISSSIALKTSSWNHILISYTSSNTTTRMFLNGAQVASSTTATWNGSSFAGQTVIGNYGSGANQTAGNALVSGYISNIRLLKGTALYTAPFVPPAAPVTAVTNTQLLVNGTNAGIFDNTTTVDLETVGSAQVSTSVVKYGTGSISFNGLNSYLISPIPAPPWLLFTNTADWTIEFWFYTGTSTGQMGLFDTYYSNTSPYSGLIIQIINGTINTYDGGANRATTTTYANSAWHHFAWVNSGGTSRVYIDGTNVTMGGVTSWATSSNIYKATAPLQIGRDFQSGYFNGYLDEIRITKGYARYTANFTPPAGPFPNY